MKLTTRILLYLTGLYGIVLFVGDTQITQSERYVLFFGLLIVVALRVYGEIADKDI